MITEVFTLNASCYSAPKPQPASSGIGIKTRISKATAPPMIQRSSSTMEESKEGNINDPQFNDYPPAPQTRKHLSETGKHLNKTEPTSSRLKHPKSSKNSISLFKEPLKEKENEIIPKGLNVIQRLGPEDYYSRFGISKIIKLPIAK